MNFVYPPNHYSLTMGCLPTNTHEVVPKILNTQKFNNKKLRNLFNLQVICVCADADAGCPSPITNVSPVLHTGLKNLVYISRDPALNFEKHVWY
jgi:hypothetical protein